MADKFDCRTVIIVYDYAFINGGAAKVAISSAIGLNKKGLNVIFFSAVGPVCKELSESGVNVVCLNMQDINAGKRLNAICYGIWNMEAKRRFTDLLRNVKRENTIVHFHGWGKALSSSVIYAASKRKFKIFVTLHEYFTLCPNGGFYNYQKECICSYKPMSIKCILSNCDKRNYLQKVWRVLRQAVQDCFVKRNKNIRFITISELNAKLVKKYVASDHFYMIKNPVQFGQNYIKNIKENEVFLFVGRISEEKGVELFCRVIERMQEKNILIEGIVVGDGILQCELMKKYPKVKFVGWKSEKDVHEYMSKARALVFPSKWYEGAPLIILEAMSIGLPCIASDCTSAVEIIENNRNGLLFRSNDVSSLEEKITLALDNEKIMRLHKNVLDDFERDEYLDEKYILNLLHVYLMI